MDFSNSDLGNMHWHDNALHAFRVVESEESCGDLVLDIDYIAEWCPPVENAFSFKVAPSDLTFHDVCDLIISIDYASASAAVQPMTIHQIHREVVTYPNGHSSFVWKIEINWPPNSFISFSSSGYTQVSRMEPVTTGAQYISPTERK